MSANLNNAFRALRKAGYFARQNFWCCQTCAWYDISEDHPDKANHAVFYHRQDNSELKRTGSTYVSWAGDVNEIMRIFEANGIKASQEEPDQRIRITCT